MSVGNCPGCLERVEPLPALSLPSSATGCWARCALPLPALPAPLAMIMTRLHPMPSSPANLAAAALLPPHHHAPHHSNHYIKGCSQYSPHLSIIMHLLPQSQFTIDQCKLISQHMARHFTLGCFWDYLTELNKEK